MRFEWRPAVGTSTNGLVTYGVRFMDDRTAKSTDASRVAISGLYPVCDHPVWQSSQLVVPQDLLMSRAWYATVPKLGDTPDPGAADSIDLAPGTLAIGITAPEMATAALVGEVWVHYTATLDGTRTEN